MEYSLVGSIIFMGISLSLYATEEIQTHDTSSYIYKLFYIFDESMKEFYCTGKLLKYKSKEDMNILFHTENDEVREYQLYIRKEINKIIS